MKLPSEATNDIDRLAGDFYRLLDSAQEFTLLDQKLFLVQQTRLSQFSQLFDLTKDIVGVCGWRLSRFVVLVIHARRVRSLSRRLGFLSTLRVDAVFIAAYLVAASR